LILFAVGVGGLGSLLGLKGTDVWIFRGFLWLIGVLGTVVVTWYFLKKPAPTGAPVNQGATREVDLLIKAAHERVSRSRVATGSSFATAPVVLWLGPEAAAKTTVIQHSGLDPELVAGEVLRGDAVVATRAINVWYSEKTLLVEVGGRLLADERGWSRVIRHLQIGRLRALLRRGGQAPRMAVVCLSCEDLLKPGGGEAVQAAAQALRGHLAEVSQRLGIRLPVYVLFTKADRIPHFSDYVRSLSRDEAREPLGAILPWIPGPTGSYAERLSQRLTLAGQRLFRSLAVRRVDLLTREGGPESRAAGYEFPRELNKLFPQVVQLLVELSRPSQLHINAFLRGFYFTGVRAVVINEAAAPIAQAQVAVPRAGATQIFNPNPPQAQPAPVAAQVRKVPEWLFLHTLLRDVMLRDRLAIGVTASGTRVQFLRRALVGAAAGLALIWTLGLVVSYVGNRRLQTEALAATMGLAGATVNPHDLAPVDVLRRLDALGTQVSKLRDYREGGAPLRLRWGLYRGSRVLPALRQVYFKEFDRLMFGATASTMVAQMRALPATPTEGTEYQATYDLLKAHLVVTTYPNQSSEDFLPPVLLNHWANGRRVDGEHRDLALRQFTLYSRELRFENPYQRQPDETAIGRARAFLRQFTGSRRIYQFMLSEAAKSIAGVKFSRSYPGAAAVVVDPYEVPPAFSREGWAFMRDAFKNVDRYFAGESWVLGDQGLRPEDVSQIVAELRSQYRADYVRHWQGFLSAARLPAFSGVADAARKLALLSGNQSPLLQLFFLTAQHTAVDSLLAATAFQPVHVLTPPGSTDQLIGEKTQAYMGALLGMQSDLEAISSSPPGTENQAVAKTISDAGTARVAARQAAQGFSTDPTSVGPDVQRLMLAPMNGVEGLLGGLGASGLNRRGRDFCMPLQRLFGQVPFRAGALSQAGLADVSSQFQRGTGAIWSFYNDVLQSYMVQQGNRYAPRPGGDLPLNPGFVEFFNRAVAFSQALYPEGAQTPRLAFTFKPLLSDLVPSVVLTVDGHSATFTRVSAAAQPFVWDAAQAREARLVAQVGGNEVTLSGQGTWGVFRLFQAADNWQVEGIVQRAQWTTRHEGASVAMPFELNLGGAPPIFSRQYFAGVSCDGRIAR
jgi:type VI secretion system protein ImpL